MKLYFLFLLFLSLGLTSLVGTNNTENDNNNTKNDSTFTINKVIFSKDTYVTDIATVFSIFILSILTTITGVGGGSLYVPVFMLINNFDIKVAIPLSVSTILGSTLVRILYFYNKEQPQVQGRSLIYFFPILIIIPLIANTSFIGIILEELLPKIVSFIVILLLLGYSFYKTLMNGIKKCRLDKHKQIKNQNIDKENFYSHIDDELTIDGIQLSITKYKCDITNKKIEVDGIEVEDDNSNHRTIHYNARDNLKKNIFMTILLLLIIIIITSFSVIRNNFKFKVCNYWYSIISLFQMVVICLFGLFIYVLIKNELKIRQDNNYLSTESDIIFTKSNVIILVLISSLTGVLATYIGIGGGTLIVPLMIHLEIAADVVVATSSVAAFFTSMVSTINYVIASKLLWIYAIVYMVFSGLGSIVGLVIFKYIDKKQYYIIFIVCFLIFNSALLLIINLFVHDGIIIFKNITINNIC